jgi:uncharacterized membrane protein
MMKKIPRFISSEEILLAGFIIIILVLGICFLVMYWGIKRIVIGTKELLNSNDRKLEEEINSIKRRLDQVEKIKNNNH